MESNSIDDLGILIRLFKSKALKQVRALNKTMAKRGGRTTPIDNVKFEQIILYKELAIELQKIQIKVTR